jgi:Flp pilus assembly protein TadG
MYKQRLQTRARQWLPMSLWRNSRGSTAVSLAVALPAILAGVGVATDYGILEMKRTHLQNVADQSAIVAVKELSLANSKKATVESVADRYAHSMVVEDGSTLKVSVSVDQNAGRVGIILREEWTPFFAHFISSEVTPVVVNATAQLSGKMNLCLLTLDPSAAKAIHMDKSARVEANGCAVYSNSKHTQAIRLDQNSSLTASAICAVGAVKAKTNAISPTPNTDCAVIPDPLSSRQAVNFPGCTAKNLVLTTGKHTLTSGRYCGGLKITGSAQVTFSKGDYAIEGGPFEISGTAKVTAQNTSFYLEGEKAALNFTGQSTVSMSGSESGTMAGLLFFEDRSVSLGRTHRINSANANELTGTIYLPRGKLRVDPNNSVAQDSAFTAIVAYQVEIDEGPTLVLNTNYSDTNVPVPAGIRINTQVVLAN